MGVWSRPRKWPFSWVAMDWVSTVLLVPVVLQRKPTALYWMSASMTKPPWFHTGVVTPMVTLTEPSSPGHAPEIQRKLFSRSPARARVRLVLPALVVRHAEHAGAAQVCIPASMAATPVASPSEAGMVARLIRYGIGRLRGLNCEPSRRYACAAGARDRPSDRAAQPARRARTLIAHPRPSRGRAGSRAGCRASPRARRWARKSPSGRRRGAARR